MTKLLSYVIRLSAAGGFILHAVVAATNMAFGSSGVDLHWLWDNRCSECHGHSADFARDFLRVSHGELQGPHHIDNLRLFLHSHYLAGKEVDAIYDMLRAQANTPNRFRNECGRCHETAAEFVRKSLAFQAGELYGRESSQAVHTFLEHHRRLEPGDVEFFSILLTRVGREVYRP